MKKTKSFRQGIGSIWFVFCFFLILLSCAKVNFGRNSGGDGGGGVAPQGAIQCSVYLNNNLSSVKIISSAENPTVKADCQPSQVTYTWIVTKNPSLPVTINGLQGSSSTADFFSSGTGIYTIVLNASAPGYTTFTSSPLTVEVGGVVPANKITCDVKLNGTLTTVNVAPNGTNPTVTATCTPVNGAYVWTVVKAGLPVQVSGLAGSSSTPAFASLAAGKYEIYVRVTKDGYGPYELTTPLVVNVGSGTLRPVTTTKKVSASDNQLDVLLIVDDSNSMLADNQKLASKLQGFVADLSASGFDWQMCVTTTRAQRYSASDPNLYWGSSVVWSGQSGTDPWVLKPSTPNLAQVFTNTINTIGAGWAGSDDERAIKAAWWHLWNGDPSYSPVSNCYRRDAGLAVVIISDEDERSVGGDKSQQYYANEFKPLEDDDLPGTYVNYVRTIFGAQKRFSVNSIIVRPGDNACLKTQDAEGTKSHYGTKYAELSYMTNGYIANICDADYAVNLKYFKDRIVSQMKSLPLECAPVGSFEVKVDPALNVNYTVQNMNLVFDPALPVGTLVTVTYQCPY